MADQYTMNVRAAETPHEVLGTLPVPLAAVQGKMMRVRFEELKPGWRGIMCATTTHDIEVHTFIGLGEEELALRVPRAKWSELKEKLT